MKLSNLSALNAYSAKRLGILFASIFIVIEIVAKITGTLETIDIHLMNLYIVGALSLAVFSKEKIDDERTQIIRYFAVKTSFKLLILGLAALYVLKINIELIYIAISSLILYLIIFYLSNYFNPGFIFKEETKSNKNNIKGIIGIMIFIGVIYLYSIIKTIINLK